MSSDLITIYEATSLMEARLLQDRLAEQNIESFVSNVDSPFDGLTAAQQTHSVSVLPEFEAGARGVAELFAADQTSSADEG